MRMMMTIYSFEDFFVLSDLALKVFVRVAGRI
jgi:hypothetical protein